jgi:hypothetical protein
VSTYFKRLGAINAGHGPAILCFAAVHMLLYLIFLQGLIAAFAREEDHWLGGVRKKGA